MRINEYTVFTDKIEKRLRTALVADLHGTPAKPVADALNRIKPDIIFACGDLTSRLDREEGDIPGDDGKKVSHIEAFLLLKEAAKIAPTFYSLGNHELCGHNYKKNYGRIILNRNISQINETGAVLLNNRFVMYNGIRIGGLTSGMTNRNLIPDTGWLEAFDATDRMKILLCHHPEYYGSYLKKRNIDLILSGHAHGGQIRLFGRGLFAPGQGVLPKYTSGLYDGRLIVSRGLANTVRFAPRLFNPRELVVVNIVPSK